MSKQLNILLVAHGLPPESVGGVEQHVDGLAQALLRAGHRVEVYARTGGPGEQGERRADSGHDYPVTRVVYRYEGLDSLASLYAQPLLDRAFASFLDGRSFDVAHVHHLTGMSTGLVDVLHRANVPAVLTLHDYWLMCPRGQMWHRNGETCERVEPTRCADCLAPSFGGWLPPDRRTEIVGDLHQEARVLLGSVDALVAPSARALPPFAALGIDTTGVHVVENGVDTPQLGNLPLPAPPHPGEPLRVGYLGTLIPSKGLEVLVQALSRLPAGRCELDIWGNAVAYHGDHGYLTRVFSRLSPTDRIRYHGPYRTDDLPGILSQVQVVAAPALWHEAFGLTVREGLAAGRPVVVSRIGGLQDAVTDGVEGLVVPPGDPGALADALDRLAGDPAEFARMAAAGRARTRGFDPMAEELVGVYRSVVRS